MASAKEILINLTKVEGITNAVFVGRDGFVIEAAGGSQVDVETLGAIVTTGFGASEVMGKELNIGNMAQIMAEFERGVIMTSAVGPDAIIAIVAEANANLGNIRFQLKRFTRELQTSL